jgi:hypothetical protein
MFVSIRKTYIKRHVMSLYSVCPHACYTANLYGLCYLIGMMTFREHLTLLHCQSTNL